MAITEHNLSLRECRNHHLFYVMGSIRQIEEQFGGGVEWPGSAFEQGPSDRFAKRGAARFTCSYTNVTARRKIALQECDLSRLADAVAALESYEANHRL